MQRPPFLKETLVQVTLLKLFIFSFFFFPFLLVDFFVLNFWVCFLNGAVELEVELLSAILLLVGHSRTLGHSLLRGLLESSLPSWNLVSLDPFQPSLLLGGQETVALCWD